MDEISGRRPPEIALRVRQMKEYQVFPEIAASVYAEIAAARTALCEWPNEAPTPLLVGLGDILAAQVAGLDAG